jgi:predicted enzyme related to lactoylglutathione lyase
VGAGFGRVGRPTPGSPAAYGQEQSLCVSRFPADMHRHLQLGTARQVSRSGCIAQSGVSAVSIRNALAGVAVRDLSASLRWYEHLLDDTAFRPMKEVGEFHFERGGSLQVFEDNRRAGASSVTLAVSDLDEQLNDLKKKGIPTDQVTRSDQVSTAIIQDPDGNQIVFAAAHSRRLAR